MFPLQRRGNIEKEVVHSFLLSSYLGSTSSSRQLIQRQSSIHPLSHSFFSLCSRYIFICLCSGWGVALNYKQRDFLCTLFNTASSAVPQTSLCRRKLGSNLGLLRLRHWMSDDLTTRLYYRTHPPWILRQQKTWYSSFCFVPMLYTQLWGGGGGEG